MQSRYKNTNKSRSDSKYIKGPKKGGYENIPTYELKDMQKFEEDPAINDIREEVIKKKEEERNQIKILAARTKPNHVDNVKKEVIMLNGNKVTFDCDGNIVYIKPQMMDRLQNDFVNPK
jgi:flagellar basal body rod protein FlgB